MDGGKYTEVRALQQDAEEQLIEHSQYRYGYILHVLCPFGGTIDDRLGTHSVPYCTVLRFVSGLVGIQKMKRKVPQQPTNLPIINETSVHAAGC